MGSMVQVCNSYTPLCPSQIISVLLKRQTNCRALQAALPTAASKIDRPDIRDFFGLHDKKLVEQIHSWIAMGNDEVQLGAQVQWRGREVACHFPN